jgi:hypothetical protein
MSTKKYHELIDKICSDLGIEDPASLYENCNLRIGDVDFTLLQGSEEDEDGLYVYCDMGEVPEELTGQLLPRLMENNLYTYGETTPHFGFNIESGRVILMNRLRLSELTFEALSDLLGSLIDYVPQWRNETLGDMRAASSLS